MTDQKLTVVIDEREALPVRAIPYVTGWDRFTPVPLVRYLAQDPDRFTEWDKPLTAYVRRDGAPVAVDPSYWDRVLRILKSFEAQSGPVTDPSGDEAWLEHAAEKIPAGVFVWLHEFTDVYRAYCDKFDEKNKTLDLDPLLMDDATRAMLMEGFAHVGAVPMSIHPEPEPAPGTAPEPIEKDTVSPASKAATDPCAVFLAMENLVASELSITFVGDKAESGLQANNMLEICARKATRRVPLASLGLIDRRRGRGSVNSQGAILWGMAIGKKLTSTPNTAANMTRLRKAICSKLGIDGDLFEPYRKGVGWVPLFKIADKRGAMDQRAKREGERRTDSFEAMTERGKQFAGVDEYGDPIDHDADALLSQNPDDDR